MDLAGRFMQIERTESLDPEPSALAPGSAVQRRLIEIWSEILEHSNFGVTDDFYEVGGDSLKAVNLIACLEAEFSLSLSSTQLYDAPTIEKQARVVNLEDDFKRHLDQPVFEMRKGESPTPLFCFPGNSGGISNFHPLVERLDPKLGVQVVLYSQLERDGPPPPMEAFAASCVQAVRSVQPVGPYHLAGFCFGASVGYEAARQLRAAGEEVATLALLEVEPGYASWPLARQFAYRKKKFFGWIRSFFVHSPPAADPLPLEERLVVPGKIARIQIAAHPILQNYKHGSYDGRLSLFRAVKGSEPVDLSYWRSLAGNLEIFSIPGGHFTMLQEPNVSTLAEILQKCLTGK